MTRRTAGLMLALGLALAGCGGDGEASVISSTETVCDDFAAHAKDGLPAADRAEVVRSISEVIANADQRLKTAHPALVRTATGSDSAYRTAADSFAQACVDAGWGG